MLDTLWRKSFRDLWLCKSRSVLVILSIAISTFTLGIIVNSYSVLSREMLRDFLKAKPAAISFNIAQFDSALLEDLKDYPGVDQVEARRLMVGEIKTGNGKWFPLHLYIIRDFSHIRVDILEPEQGNWPPQQNQVLIEQQALSVFGGEIGDIVDIKLGSGLSAKLQLSGTAHDVILPQAEWENIVYAYVSVNTYTKIKGSGGFNQLKVSLTNPDQTHQQKSEFAEALKNWIVQQQYRVLGFTVAPPLEPPHANITNGMFLIQKVFALLCCLLSSVLVFNLVSANVSNQLPQIGVMKALGATSLQITSIYYRGIVLLGVLGLLIGMPLAFIGSIYYIDMLAKMMNIDIASYRQEVGLIILQIGLGLGLPLAVASLPIRRASYMSIRETFIDFGWQALHFGGNRLERGLLKLNFLSKPTQLAIRNCLRRKSRFVLTTSVLMFAATLLMATFNVANTMQKVVDDERLSHHWDLSIWFNQSYSQETINKHLSAFSSIQTSEVFSQTRAIVLEDVKSHTTQQTVTIKYVNPSSNMLNLPVISGRWLQANAHEVVVSQMVMKQKPYLKLGEPISMHIEGKDIDFTLVGIVKVLGLPVVYTSADLLSTPGGNAMFIVASEQSPDSLYRLKNSIRETERVKELSIRSIKTRWEGLAVIEDHLDIIFSLMMVLTVIIMFIAGNGVILSMTTNILERTKEIGILKAIGGSNYQLAKMTLIEAVVIAFLAWCLACLLTLPISYWMVYWLGILLIETPLPLVIDPIMFLLSLPILIILTSVASIIPMRQIMRLPVREALLFE